MKNLCFRRLLSSSEAEQKPLNSWKWGFTPWESIPLSEHRTTFKLCQSQ